MTSVHYRYLSVHCCCTAVSALSAPGATRFRVAGACLIAACRAGETTWKETRVRPWQTERQGYPPALLDLHSSGSLQQHHHNHPSTAPHRRLPRPFPILVPARPPPQHAARSPADNEIVDPRPGAHFLSTSPCDQSPFNPPRCALPGTDLTRFLYLLCAKRPDLRSTASRPSSPPTSLLPPSRLPSTTGLVLHHLALLEAPSHYIYKNFQRIDPTISARAGQWRPRRWAAGRRS